MAAPLPPTDRFTGLPKPGHMDRYETRHLDLLTMVKNNDVIGIMEFTDGEFSMVERNAALVDVSPTTIFCRILMTRHHAHARIGYEITYTATEMQFTPHVHIFCHSGDSYTTTYNRVAFSDTSFCSMIISLDALVDTYIENAEKIMADIRNLE